MSSQVSKRKKEEGDEEDRISSLSDDVIHLILSFMNTKYAIQTCVLSKRWKSVWKSLPYLDFNHQTFPFNGDRRKRKFAKSVSLHRLIVRVLSRRQHGDLVRVCYKSPYFEAHTLRELIAYAVNHNLKQLTIQLGKGWTSYFPDSFYTCKSLTALQVFGKGIDTIKSLKSMALPALKSLRIYGCSVSNGSFNADGFSGFPNLETLELIEIRCAEDNTFLYVVAPPNLKKLELSFSKDHEGNGCQVVIRAPRLMTFKYCGSASMRVYLLDDDDFASLHDAYLDIHSWDIWVSKASARENGKLYEPIAWVLNLNKFRHAESLTLSSATVMVLSGFPSLLNENQLAFSNLKYLKIKLVPGQPFNDKLVETVGCFLNSFRNSSTTVKYFV